MERIPHVATFLKVRDRAGLATTPNVSDNGSGCVLHLLYWTAVFVNWRLINLIKKYRFHITGKRDNLCFILTHQIVITIAFLLLSTRKVRIIATLIVDGCSIINKSLCRKDMESMKVLDYLHDQMYVIHASVINAAFAWPTMSGARPRDAYVIRSLNLAGEVTQFSNFLLAMVLALLFLQTILSSLPFPFRFWNMNKGNSLYIC